MAGQRDGGCTGACEGEDGLRGWGGVIVDVDTGVFEVKTVKPGAAMGLSEQTHRRQTLVAHADGNRYHFDICPQGDNETVFFDV